MPSAGLGSLVDLVEDQLETEQADLTHDGRSLPLIVPILGESKLLLIEAQRALGVFDEEHAPRIEVVHRPFAECAPMNSRIALTNSGRLGAPRSPVCVAPSITTSLSVWSCF